MQTLKNSEIVAATCPDALTFLEKQIRFIAKQFRQPLICGVCGESHSQEEASGIPLDDMDFTGHEIVFYRCPTNDVPLNHILPLIGAAFFTGVPKK